MSSSAMIVTVIPCMAGVLWGIVAARATVTGMDTATVTVMGRMDVGIAAVATLACPVFTSTSDGKPWLLAGEKAWLS